MRRVGLLGIALVCACNLITGASKLEPTLDEGCPNCLPDGGRAPDVIDVGDSAVVSDVQKDGDDLTPGGFLDATFGTSGIVRTSLLPNALAVAVDSIGRAHVVGNDGTHLAVVRFTADGKVDASFGTSGKVAIPMGAASGGGLPNIAVPDPLAGIAIDSLDRVVIGGTTQETFILGDGTRRYERYLYAARIKDGAPDPSFGQEGKYRPNPRVNGEGARAVAIAAGDKVVLVGSGPSGSFTVWGLTETGAADPEFGSGGRVVIPVSNATSALAGTLSAAGVFAVGGSSGDFAVGHASGITDAAPSFGGEGGVATVATGPGDDVARAVTVMPDGRIVVGGKLGTSGVRTSTFGVARLAPNGATDTTFAATGIALFDFDSGGTWKEIVDGLHGLVVDSRGRVVVAGSVLEKPPQGSGFYRTVLARLKDDGSLDPLFATGGRLSFTDPPEHRLRGSALARAATGALYVAGSVDGKNEIFVARITP